MTSNEPTPIENRRRWMGVLAKASSHSLKQIFETIEDRPDYRWLRAPEIGMVMVRGRQDGVSRPFNMGELTVTRCALEVEGGIVGTAYVMGRDRNHAANAALADAMLQDPSRHDDLISRVIEPLDQLRQRQIAKLARQTSSTRVEFFTLARGE